LGGAPQGGQYLPALEPPGIQSGVNDFAANGAGRILILADNHIVGSLEVHPVKEPSGALRVFNIDRACPRGLVEKEGHTIEVRIGTLWLAKARPPMPPRPSRSRTS
jgi:hypothetical protein